VVDDTSTSPAAAAADAELAAEIAAEIAAEQDHYAEALQRFRGDVRMMEQVLATMIERRVPRGELHLSLMLDQYLAGRELRKARAIITQLDEAGIALDPARRYAGALATAAVGQGAEALTLVERLAADGHHPARDQAHAVVGLLVGVRRAAAAWPLYRRSAAAGRAADRDVHLALLADALGRRAAKDTLLVLRAMLAAGQRIPTLRAAEALQMLSRVGQVERGLELFDLLAAAPDDVAATPDGETLGVLLEALARRGRVEDVAALVARVAGDAPGGHLRNAVLAARLGAGDLPGAWAELEGMWADGLLPTAANLEALLDAEVAAGANVRAAGILDWLVVIGAPVTPTRSGPVLRAELAAGLEAGLRLATALLDAGQPLDRAAARDLVERLVRARRLDDARTWLERLRVAGILTLGRSWGSLLAALVAAKRADEAVTLLEELVAAGVAPEPADVTRLVSGRVRVGDRARAERLASAASAAGVHLPEEALRELLWAHARAGDAPAVERVLALLTAAGIAIDERHEKARAWATGETRRRLDEPAEDATAPAGDATAPAASDGAPAPDAPTEDPGPSAVEG
jgi:pentatricopeptide repeat protein